MTRHLLFAAACSLALSACGGAGGGGTPSEADARAFLASQVDGGRTDRLELTSFAKTDGVAGEVSGVRTYVMSFTARADVRQEAYVMLQDPVAMIGLRVLELPQSDGFFAMMRPPEFDYATKLAPGAAVQMTGQMTFQQRESGWAPTNIELSAHP